MPPHPPPRTAAGDYHYHVYDYRNAPTRGTWGLSDPVATRGNYRFYSMVQDLQGLVTEGKSRYVPGIALSRVGPKTAKGRRTLVLSFGNYSGQPNQRTVVITGGIHAREWIATEMAYLLAEYLIVNYNTSPPPGNPRLKALRNLIDNRNIVIIPMLNPDGIDRTVFGTGTSDRLWRKNLRAMPGTARGWADLLAPYKQPNPPYRNVRAPGRPKNALAQYDVPTYDPDNDIPPKTAKYKTRSLAASTTGVDLNRNLPTKAYGYDDPDVNDNGDWDPRGDTFHGTGAASEPEIANVRTAMLQATRTARTAGRVWVTIDYHSYGKKILYGCEATKAGLAAAHMAVGRMLENLIRDTNGPTYTLESGSPLLDYLSTGTVDDYTLQAHQAKAFTIELDPADPKKGEVNPIEFKLPEDQILDCFRQNIRAALAAISAPVNAQEAQNAVNSYLGWNVYNAGNQVP